MQRSQLQPGSWKDRVQELSEKWRALTPMEQELYAAKAAEEQAFRENAAHEPFHSKAEVEAKKSAVAPVDNAAQNLSRNARKTVARQRVMATYQRFISAPEWKSHDAGISSAVGALDLDYVNMDLTDQDVNDKWDGFSMPHGDLPLEWKEGAKKQQEIFRQLETECHHTVCHAEYGVCSSSPWLAVVTKYVYSLSDFVASGAWASVLICVLGHGNSNPAIALNTPTNC